MTTLILLAAITAVGLLITFNWSAISLKFAIAYANSKSLNNFRNLQIADQESHTLYQYVDSFRASGWAGTIDVKRDGNRYFVYAVPGSYRELPSVDDALYVNYKRVGRRPVEVRPGDIVRKRESDWITELRFA